MAKVPWRIRHINWWPPLAAAGISVVHRSEDATTFDVQLKTHFWNKNYQGAHYGGSLFSMTDPFYALILISNLGKDYVVWDKSATIRFKKPGQGTLTAHFNISKERIAEIKAEADGGEKSEPKFTVLIKDESGDTVAEVDKLLSVKRKDKVRPR